MALSEARKQANKRWNDANMKERYDRIQLVVPKGRKEKIQEYAREHGESLNGFIVGLIDREIGALNKETATDEQEFSPLPDPVVLFDE